MKAKRLILGLLFFSLTMFAADYAFYYDCTEPRETIVLVSNLSEENAELRLFVFNSRGEKLFERLYRMKPFQTIFLNLSNVLDVDERTWGLVLVRSEQLLYVSAVYQDEQAVVSIDHVIESIMVDEDAERYWYSLHYLNLEGWETWFAIMNPNEIEAEVDVYVYDGRSGDLVDSFSGTLKPFASAYLDLSKVEGLSDYGPVDIECDVPVVVGVEYWYDGKISEVDNVVDWYATVGE